MMKLKNKLFFSTTFLYILIITIVSFTIYFTFSKLTYDRELERVELSSQNVVKLIQGTNQNFPVQELLTVSVPTDGMIRIVSETSIVSMIISGEKAHLMDYPHNYQSGKKLEVIQIGDEKFGFVQLPLIWHDGEVVYFQMIESFQSVQNNLKLLSIVLIFVAIIAIVPVLVSGKVITDLIIRPIHSLIQTMNEIRTSNQFKHIPLKKESQDELYTMTKTFNDMINLLKDNYERQEAFVSNASHELRTPLTVIESYSSLLKRRGLENRKVVEEAVEAIHSEAQRMKSLTEQLLLLARRDKDWVINVEKVSLNKLLFEIKTNIERAYNRTVNFETDEEIEIKTDEKKLHQLLYIFIDNARKYSEEHIDIKLFKQNKEAVIIIRDYGIGIPDDAVEHIFDRFYRVDEARTSDIGGTGLGLSLAKDIADAIDVHIEVQSKVNVGTTIILTINSLTSH